jgi:hypothetical protein
MNNGQHYRLDHTTATKEQIRFIAESVRKAGKLSQFIDILKKATHLLKNDPHGWGDPVRHTKGTDGVVCHGILRPVVFHFVIFEKVCSVLLYDVRLFAEFPAKE